jgi:flagellin
MYAMATGKTVNSAGDDPTKMAQADRATARIDSLEQADKNMQNNAAIFKQADDTLGTMEDMIGSLRDKVVAAANSSTTVEDRKKLLTEIDSMLSRYDNVVDSAKFGKRKFFDSAGSSDFANTPFYAQYGADAGEGISFKFDYLKSASGLQLTSTTFSVMGEASTTGSAISNIVSTVDTALNKIIDQRAKVGSYEQSFGYMQEGTANQVTATRQYRSSLVDTDTAKGMSDFMIANIATQASQLMLAQSGQLPGWVLSALQS